MDWYRYKKHPRIDYPTGREPPVSWISHEESTIHGASLADLTASGYTAPGWYYWDESYNLYGPFSAVDVEDKFFEFSVKMGLGS